MSDYTSEFRGEAGVTDRYLVGCGNCPLDPCYLDAEKCDKVCSAFEDQKRLETIGRLALLSIDLPDPPKPEEGVWDLAQIMGFVDEMADLIPILREQQKILRAIVKEVQP